VNGLLGANALRHVVVALTPAPELFLHQLHVEVSHAQAQLIPKAAILNAVLLIVL